MQLAQLPDDGNRYELVDGELRMMSPAGGRHGRVAHNLALLLGNHVRAQDLGVVFAAETGFLISRNPDNVRAPDVAFIRKNRYQDLVNDDAGYVPVVPDLVAEIMSPTDTKSAMDAKNTAWLEAGVQIAIVVDPAARTLTEFHSTRPPTTTFAEDDVYAEDTAVAGWRFTVSELF